MRAAVVARSSLSGFAAAEADDDEIMAAAVAYCTGAGPAGLVGGGDALIACRSIGRRRRRSAAPKADWRPQVIGATAKCIRPKWCNRARRSRFVGARAICCNLAIGAQRSIEFGRMCVRNEPLCWRKMKNNHGRRVSAVRKACDEATKTKIHRNAQLD